MVDRRGTRVSKLGAAGVLCGTASLALGLIAGNGLPAISLAMVGAAFSAAAVLSAVVAEDIGPRMPVAAVVASVAALVLSLLVPWSASENAARRRDVGLPPSVAPRPATAPAGG